MKMNPWRLKQFGQERFDQQMAVLSLWQELAEHFYPERAHFTRQHFIGAEMADNLASSQPLLIRRELANSLEGMLRDGEWFKIGIEGEPDTAGKQWLEWASKRMLTMFNQRPAGFRRATKEADNDYVTFGQAVMSIEMDRRRRNGLLFRTWEMSNCAWWDNEQGEVDGLVRRWRCKLHEALNYFGKDNLHPNMIRDLNRDMTYFKDVEFWHFDMPVMLYGDEELGVRFDRVSCWLDPKHEHIVEKVGANTPSYIVPRFQTIAGSPYAYSPATVVGLPDARTLQAMTHTLLEAGERIARPPMVAQDGVIRGDANLYPDGITFLDQDYDERSGEGLRPLVQDTRGFPWGLEMREGIVEVLQGAFYVNKINLPETDREMTAYEVEQRMKQYRRENLPLFTPIEHEYSGRMCEVAFDLLFQNGFLGSPQDLPQSLLDQERVFRFESPLSAAEEERKVQQFRLTAQLLGEAAEIDPSLHTNVDFDQAFRDAMEGQQAPAKWLREVDEVTQRREEIEARERAMLEAQANQGRAA